MGRRRRDWERRLEVECLEASSSVGRLSLVKDEIATKQG